MSIVTRIYRIKNHSGRSALLTTAALVFIIVAGAFADQPGNTIYTVTGPIRLSEVQGVLPHEHLNSFFRSPKEALLEYDEAKAADQILTVLQTLKSQGINLVMDCTTINFGRHPVLLKRISEESGIYIMVSTGIYGAAGQEYVPLNAYVESAEALASRWISEFQDGIPATDIRPGFIKVGVDKGSPSSVERKLVRAAALTHKATGLTIANHVSGGNLEAAKVCLDILKEEGVSPEAWIFVHAQGVKDSKDLIQLARQGVWIELDGLRDDPKRIEQHLSHLVELKEAGLLHKVLLSHDGGAAPLGRTPRPMTTLMDKFVPLLRETGFSQTDIDQLIKVNPVKAFTVRRRILNDS